MATDTATREAIKFDQRARRTVAIPTGGDDDRAAEPADERARPELRVELLAALDVAVAGMNRPGAGGSSACTLPD